MPVVSDVEPSNVEPSTGRRCPFLSLDTWHHHVLSALTFRSSPPTANSTMPGTTRCHHSPPSQMIPSSGRHRLPPDKVKNWDHVSTWQHLNASPPRKRSGLLVPPPQTVQKNSCNSDPMVPKLCPSSRLWGLVFLARERQVRASPDAAKHGSALLIGDRGNYGKCLRLDQ